MKTISKLFISVLATVALCNVASAKDRYLVIYKSQQGFAAMNQFMLTEGVASIKVEESLVHINGQVLQTSNPKAIAALRTNPEVEVIEAETFTPAPKPVNGFKLSKAVKAQAWAQEVPSQDNDSQSVPHLNEGVATPWGIMAVHAGEAWDNAKAGAKARILVLDTGIDKNHPALKNNFEQGRNFFQSFDGPNPDDFADKEGHGTHCSGTIAGAYNEATGFTGVAPLAKLLMGRVCGDLGCSNVAVAQGINWGVEQKVDVISMSLGGPATSTAERKAVENAEKAGVVVVAASGNGGNAAVSFPAALPNVIAVGAIDSSITKTSFSQWGPELDIVAPGAAVVSSVPQGTGRDSNTQITVAGVSTVVKSAAFSGTKLFATPKVATLVPAGLGKPEDFAKVDVKGKFALISRGEITFADKIKNAMAAGATGAVIYNNTTGLMQGALTEDGSELDAAVVMIEQSVGQDLVAKITAGTEVSAAISTSPSDYAMFDGTSMATPHVAGVVALIKSANKKLTPAQVRTIIATTARPLSPNDQNQYGKGLIQADAAVKMAVGQ
ncbi:serine protease [Bdellovibrio sp. qaytius]|nr:serine protease [Bdellovibrio sp. qaytius]